MRILAGVALKHPQSAYAGLQNYLQQEWAFVQRVTPGVGGSIRPSRGGPPEGLCPGSLTRPAGGTDDAREHPSAGEAGRPGLTIPGKDGP